MYLSAISPSPLYFSARSRLSRTLEQGVLDTLEAFVPREQIRVTNRTPAEGIIQATVGLMQGQQLGASLVTNDQGHLILTIPQISGHSIVATIIHTDPPKLAPIEVKNLNTPDRTEVTLDLHERRDLNIARALVRIAEAVKNSAND